MNLNVNEWKEFAVGRLFNMKRGHTLSVKDKEEYIGSVPCVNGTIENNGVQCFVSDSIKEIGFDKIKAPALSIVRVGNGGKTFLQTEDFYVADNAFALISKENLSEECLIFMSPLLDTEQIKYSYGRTVTSNYVNTVINLPIQHNADGTPFIDDTKKYSDEGYVPDWQFMEDYIKSLHHKPLTTQNKQGQVPELMVDEWKEFSINEIFTIIEPGKISNASELDEGNEIPYLGAKRNDNGVMQYCIDVPEKRSRGNCVVMICDGEGSVGYANYMESDFLGTVNLMLGYNDSYLNSYTGIFLATVLSQERPKYSFGRKWKTHIPDMIIKLPVTDDGNPDWQFMADYIKKLPYGDRI